MGARVSLIAVLILLVVGSFPANATQRGVLERNCLFSPSLIFINPGDTVTWTYGEDASSSCDGLNHRVVSQPGDPQSFDSSPGCSGPFSPRHSCMNDPPKRKTFSVTLTRPGTYRYYCSFHGSIDASGNCSGMCGEVVINSQPTQPSSPSATATPTRAHPTSTASASASTTASASASASPSGSPSVLASGSNGAGGARRGIIAVAVIAVLAALGTLVWRTFLAQR